MTKLFKAERSGESEPYRVGIQGCAGAFHHLAADAFFTKHSYEVVSYPHFLPLAKSLAGGKEIDLALMAIENSLAGSLLPNYHLLIKYGLLIRGEIYLRIKHNLLAIEGQSVDELEEVHSHPMAIEQCRPFFADYPKIRLVEAEDTALSALRISKHGRKKVGAIASSLAGELYGLEVLSAGIESNPENYTRFLIVSRFDELPVISDVETKISICMTLGHEVGTLSKVLQAMAAWNLNLIKIQSVPIHGKPWRYRFFMDFLQPANSKLEEIITQIRRATVEFHLLGVYESGQHIHLNNE